MRYVPRLPAVAWPESAGRCTSQYSNFVFSNGVNRRYGPTLLLRIQNMYESLPETKLCLRIVIGRLLPLGVDEAIGSGIARSSISRGALPTFCIVSFQATSLSATVYST